MSSRIGTERTLVTGLAVIAVSSALAGPSGSNNGIVGFRAGWGPGNALFIATSLAVIVASAPGGFAGAIVLDEAAPGLGIGPARAVPRRRRRGGAGHRRAGHRPLTQADAGMSSATSGTEVVRALGRRVAPGPLA